MFRKLREMNEEERYEFFGEIILGVIVLLGGLGLVSIVVTLYFWATRT